MRPPPLSLHFALASAPPLRAHEAQGKRALRADGCRAVLRSGLLDDTMIDYLYAASNLIFWCAQRPSGGETSTAAADNGAPAASAYTSSLFAVPSRCSAAEEHRSL